MLQTIVVLARPAAEFVNLLPLVGLEMSFSGELGDTPIRDMGLVRSSGSWFRCSVAQVGRWIGGPALISMMLYWARSYQERMQTKTSLRPPGPERAKGSVQGNRWALGHCHKLNECIVLFATVRDWLHQAANESLNTGRLPITDLFALRAPRPWGEHFGSGRQPRCLLLLIHESFQLVGLAHPQTDKLSEDFVDPGTQLSRLERLW